MWYLRAVLPERNESVAVFCGSGVVASNGTEEVMPIYVAILHGDPSTGKTFVYERLAKDLGAVSVTHMGRQVTEKPTWDAPPAMRWALHEETQGQGKGLRAEEEREVAVLSTMGDLAVVRFEAGGAVVKMVVKVSTSRFTHSDQYKGATAYSLRELSPLAIPWSQVHPSSASLR